MNIEKLTKDINQRAEDTEKKAFENITIELKPEEIVNFKELNDELDISGKMLCASCGNIPIAPVKNCDKCEVLYCNQCLEKMKSKDFLDGKFLNIEGNVCKRGTDKKGNFYCGQRRQIPGTDGRCGPTNGNNCESCKVITTKYKDINEDDLKEQTHIATCCNLDCEKINFSNYKDIGRHVRNVIQSFEFQNGEEVVIYQKMISEFTRKFKEDFRWDCEFCSSAKQMTKEGYVSHQLNDCQDVHVECVNCEHSHPRSLFEDQESHWCERNLITKIEKLRSQLKEGKDVVKGQEKEATRIMQRVKDYEHRIENMVKHNEDCKVQIEKNQKIMEDLKSNDKICEDATILIDKSQLIELKIPEKSIQIECSDQDQNVELVKELFKNGDVKVKDLKVGSWVQINLKKPCVMNGMGMVFAEKIGETFSKPQGLKIFVKEFPKDDAPEADKIEQNQVEGTQIEEVQANDEESKVEEPEQIQQEKEIIDETQASPLPDGFQLMRDCNEEDFKKLGERELCDKIVFNKANLLVSSIRIEFGHPQIEGQTAYTLSGLSLFF